MDMIEVDPKLFVTCRLCLLDMGQYQIIPIVQQQIKYCFDIDVGPFDGLPQLICIKCKGMLTNFYTIKKTLCEKQSNLRSKVNKKDINALCMQPQQNTVSSSQPTTENVDIIRKSKSKKVIDSSDSEDTINLSNQNNSKKIVKQQNNWDWTGYKRNCVCVICKTEWPNLKSLVIHKRVHFKIRANYATVFSKNCSIVLHKVDNKPNFTGKENIVVHDQNKIIEHCNSSYYIKYSKETKDGNNSESGASITLYKNKKLVDIESSDTEQEISARPKRKKRRILSRCSSDTVVIESNGNKTVESEDDTKPMIKAINTDSPAAQISTDQCINIDDSSDSDQEKEQVTTRQQTKQPLEAKLSDYKIIHGIITTCVNAYHRKMEATDKSDKTTSSESHLKHKILNIGSKIINRQGSNWNGLLKYMEHKDLEIIWATKALPNSNSKEANYIRIMSKLRDDTSLDDNEGWEPVVSRNLTPVPKQDTSLCGGWSMPLLTDNLCKSQTPMDATLLPICSSPDPRNKLLNANPVANPKQLPKKLGQGVESRIKPALDSNFTFQNNEENDASMPIITSTTSLAVPATTDIQDESSPVSANGSIETTAPRIKVKPVTELMSERILNSLRNEQQSAPADNILNQIEKCNEIVLNQVDSTKNLVLKQNTWVPQKSMANMYLSNIVPHLTVANPPIQFVPLSCLNVTTSQSFPALAPVVTQPTPKKNNNSEEYVLLNTVDLPNTKSKSPFKYLQKLLQMHNLTLLDPRDTLPRDFVCLIKFKVQFKQEPIDEPVVLCLSLFYNKNEFCFTVKDEHKREINIDKVSPNWQWEILNVFRGDLVDKLLQNSQKHSQETYDSTKQFLCLLKSINFSKLP